MGHIFNTGVSLMPAYIVIVIVIDHCTPIATSCLTKSSLTVLASAPIGSGYWWVRSASRAVKEHRPAVNTMKNGSSFLGYTDTSWKAGKVNNILKKILTAFTT